MRSIVRLAAASAFMMAASLSFAATINSLHLVTRQSMAGGKSSSKMEIWVKNGKMRTQSGPNIQIVNGKEMMMYQTANPSKQAMAMPVPPEMKTTSTAALIKRMSGAAMLKNGKKVGTGKILGHPVTILQSTSPYSKDQKMKFYMANDLGFPLKVEIQGPNGQKMTYEALKVEVNPKISDSLFALPKGYKKTAIPAPSRHPVSPRRPKK